MALSLRMALRGDVRDDFDDRVRRLNAAHEDTLKVWGKDLKELLRAQLAGVTAPGRNRAKGQDILKSWTDRFYKNKGSDPAELVYSGAPSIIELLAEGGTVRPRRARMLVVALPAAVRLGLDRVLSDRGGGARHRKYSDLAAALQQLGRLRRIARPDGSVVLALEPRRFRAAGGRGRFTRQRGDLIPLFVLMHEIRFNAKIDPDSLARAHVERLPDYLNAALDRQGFE